VRSARDGDVPAARQVAARVSAAIAREPARVASLLGARGREALMRSVAGLAVAAGVAFGAVLLVQQVDGTRSPVGAEAVIAQAAEPPVVPVSDAVEPEDTLASSYVTPPATDAPGGLPQAELANYLVAHYGYASPLVRRSVGAGLISAPAGTMPAEGTGEETRISQ
jgi:negative regulator of sigma E activity